MSLALEASNGTNRKISHFHCAKLLHSTLFLLSFDSSLIKVAMVSKARTGILVVRIGLKPHRLLMKVVVNSDIFEKFWTRR